MAELADMLYIAPATFSRLFKKKMQMTYGDYLNQVRLYYAVQDLLYTNHSIAGIANNHGFSNASAFCKNFKDKYEMSPVQY